MVRPVSDEDILKRIANKVARGEAILNRAVNAKKISECGLKAVLAATDPFHDKPIEGLRGWPDLETGPSVVRHWKSSSTVKALEDGGAIMVYSWPILNDCQINSTSRRNGIIDTIVNTVGQTSTVAPTAIYNMTQAQAGSDPMPLVGTALTTHAIPNNYFGDGGGRLIGMGIEVHDVTADIYKQGTCTVFEVPQSTADRENDEVKAQTIGGLAYTQTSVETCVLNRYPSTLEEIMKYKNKQWDAKEGAYVVIPFTGQENPSTYCEYRSPKVLNSPSNLLDRPNTVNTSAELLGNFASGGVAGEPFVFLANAFAPVHSRGIFLSGLNANSTFTITTSFFYETFPVQASPLLPIAAPSCPYDPKAMQLISVIMQEMPVGCRVKDNPLGEWFYDIVETALPVLGTVGSALFPEFAPLIAPASAAGTAWAANERAKIRKERKQQKARLKNDVKREVRRDLDAIQKKK